MTIAPRSVIAVFAMLFAFAVSAAFAGEAASDGQQQTITPEQAFAIMTREANNGNPAAMLSLGSLHERGVGTARNFVKAFEWYKKAADAGLAEAYYNVGVCYETGIGNGGDARRAFENFEKSAELGLPQGYYKLATLYLSGLGVEKNESWGVELLKRAVDAGHMIAANDLGLVHHAGMYGQRINEELAFDLFTRAAELGNAEAMKNIAVFYRDGIGRTADPREELKWYILSRRAGFPAGAIDEAIRRIGDEIGPEQARQAEAEAETWIADFQKRREAAAAQQ